MRNLDHNLPSPLSLGLEVFSINLQGLVCIKNCHIDTNWHGFRIFNFGKLKCIVHLREFSPTSVVFAATMGFLTNFYFTFIDSI